MWSIFSRDPLSSFPYEVGEQIEMKINSRSIWKLHKGRKKQGGDEVGIFLCDSTDNGSFLEASRIAIKRLKTLRHPCILTYIDSLEKEKLVYLVTEPVIPLVLWLQENELSSFHQTVINSWGLLYITKALGFLNNEGGLSHFNVNSFNIFVTKGGEWKLGGLEFSSTDYTSFPVVSVSLNAYDPPEKHDYSKMKTITRWAADMWGLGCLIWEVYNGPLDQSMQLKNTSKIPKFLTHIYCELIAANPSSRPNPQDLVVKLRQPSQFCSGNYIDTLLFLDEIHIKDDNEKHRYFSELASKLDNIPEFMSKYKILPALVKAYEFSNAGSVVLTALFKIGKLLNENEYQSMILPCVVKLFSSPDRATRLKLLQQIEDIVEHVDQKTANEQIFPNLATGFLDTNPAIREHTIKTILHLAPKLNSNNLDIEVMKHFARLQSRDDQGGIRTNTTVCLGRISCYLQPDTRKKCLVSAFTRAMRDPFPPARSAGVMALAATQQYYELGDVACKILPALCYLTVDPDKTARDGVFKVLKGFVSKLEKVSEDPTLREQMESEVNSMSCKALQSSSWAGWAVGALTSKFYKSSISQAPQETTKPEANLSPLSPPSASSELGAINSGIPNEDADRALRTNLNPIEALNASMDLISPGAWGDEDTEEWGNLEMAEPINKNETAASSTFTWEESASKLAEDDFFSSISGKPAANKHNKKEVSSGWDEGWGESGNLIDLGADLSMTSKIQRDERRHQREKEIVARRVTRSGPMKLGSRKC